MGEDIAKNKVQNVKTTNFFLGVAITMLIEYIVFARPKVFPVIYFVSVGISTIYACVLLINFREF